LEAIQLKRGRCSWWIRW